MMGLIDGLRNQLTEQKNGRREDLEAMQGQMKEQEKALKGQLKEQEKAMKGQLKEQEKEMKGQLKEQQKAMQGKLEESNTRVRALEEGKTKLEERAGNLEKKVRHLDNLLQKEKAERKDDVESLRQVSPNLIASPSSN